MLKKSLPFIKTSFPGPKTIEVLSQRKLNIPNAIGSIYPIVINEGAGAMIEDIDGNRYLDWIGGVGVLNIGHCHPEVVAAVKEQAGRYFHSMMNITTHTGYTSLAEKLNTLVPVRGEKHKTMFANSGAEANENAVKIAKAYTKRPNIIVFSSAFHGRTLLTMAMTAKKAYALGMGPFPDGVYRAEFPNLYRKPAGLTDKEAIEYYIKQLHTTFEEATPYSSTAAIVVEPVQGEGGFVPAPIEWVKEVRKICDEHGILLIADEIQTGFARSGKLFVSNYWAEEGCAPDIITTAKSIAAGIPLSAVTAREEIFDAVPGGVIGGTYGGNALACAAGLKVLEVIEKEKLCDRALEISEICKKEFLRWKEKYEIVGDVRGIGSMIGIEFVKDKKTKEPAPQIIKDIIKYSMEHGLLVESAGTYSNVIRFLCPLVVTTKQLEAGFKIYEDAIQAAIKN